MISEGKSLLAAAIATVFLVAPAQSSIASTPSVPYSNVSIATAAISMHELNVLREAAGESLLAVGRVDAVSTDKSQIYLMGQTFQVLANPVAQSLLQGLDPGDPIALLGELTPYGYLVESGLSLKGLYVPGASMVYLRGAISALDSSSGQLSIGKLVASTTGGRYAAADLWSGSSGLVEIVGTQPAVGGVVLVDSMVRKSASVGTGKKGASVGTGRAGASVGTGKAGASVGTGKKGASVGTGRAGASVGTGKAGASVGTGKKGASVGTGRAGASVGTGKMDLSVSQPTRV